MADAAAKGAKHTSLVAPVQASAGRTNETARDHGGDGAIPRWAVGIAVMLAVLWATYLLLSGGEPVRQAGDDAALRDTVEVSLVRSATADAGAPGPFMAAGSSEDAAMLVGPTWVAEDIRSRGVIDDLQSHVTLTAAGEAHGFGGCNNFTGRYTLDGTTLMFGPLASTKKACPPAIMNQEAGFHEALGEIRGYRFENGLLFLLDAQGTALMRLWRRD
jgi:heat shock protein HslJ